MVSWRKKGKTLHLGLEQNKSPIPEPIHTDYIPKCFIGAMLAIAEVFLKTVPETFRSWKLWELWEPSSEIRKQTVDIFVTVSTNQERYLGGF